jgi:hypothetical protein
MNTLQPNISENKDFSPIQYLESGLISYFLNTLRKNTGEREDRKKA